MGLSVKNGWLDEQGRVCIIFPMQEVMDALGCADIAISMGWQQPDELPTTLSTLMAKAMNDQCIPPDEGILHHAEGVDLIPANIELAGLEVTLVNSMNREKMLKQVLDSARREYDYIDYYNNSRIQTKTKWMPPSKFREASMMEA